MICTFIGHRNAPFSVKESLKAEIVALIEHGTSHFYVGNNGNFDYLAQSVMIELANEFSHIKFDIVLSYIDEKSLVERNDLTVFPEELAGVPKKFAICKRNAYLLKKSDIIISYVRDTTSNSYKFIEKALKKGCKIINL